MRVLAVTINFGVSTGANAVGAVGGVTVIYAVSVVTG